MWIFLTITAVFILFFGFIVVSPFFISFESSLANERFSAHLTAHWMHPVLLGLRYTFNPRAIEVKIFGKLFVGKAAPQDTEERAQTGHVPPGSASQAHAVPPSEEQADGAPAPHGEGNGGVSIQRPPDAGAGSEGQDAGNAFGFSTSAAGLPPARETPAQGRGTDPAAEEEKQSFRWKLEDSKAVFLLRQKKLLAGSWRCAASVLRAALRIIRFETFVIRVKAGAEDPAIPGMIFGYITGLRNALIPEKNRHAVIEFEPVFNNPDLFEYECRVRVSTSVGRVIRPFLAGVVTFPYLQALIAWRRMKNR